MKYLFLIVVLVYNCSTARGQDKIYGSFNSSFSTINIVAGYVHKVGSNEFGLGIRRNISEVAHRDDLEYPIKRRLFRRRGNEIENWGLHAFYQRNLPKYFTNLDLFFFYDFQITHSSAWFEWHLPTDIYVNGNRAYRRIDERHGPYTWVEQTCGIGFSFNLSSNIKFIQRAGIGNAFVIGNSEIKERYNLNYVHSDFAVLWSAGLAYSF